MSSHMTIWAWYKTNCYRLSGVSNKLQNMLNLNQKKPTNKKAKSGHQEKNQNDTKKIEAIEYEMVRPQYGQQHHKCNTTFVEYQYI